MVVTECTKIIIRYKRPGYNNINVMPQTACLVVNPFTVNNFAALLYAGESGLGLNEGSGLITFTKVGWGSMLYFWSDPPGFSCWISVAPAFQWGSCCWVLILCHFSIGSWFICLLFWCIDELEVLHTDRITCMWTTAEPMARVVRT